MSKRQEEVKLDPFFFSFACPYSFNQTYPKLVEILPKIEKSELNANVCYVVVSIDPTAILRGPE